ncbi:MAG: antiviral reverse transcriptase Drt3a, partial [Bacteroidales bacterium]|nr:antiviral reverse transcriptase Drt3a [Bacteroidales bacterium]
MALHDELCSNAHPYGSVEYLCQDLLIRKLSVNIMHSYRIKPTNRNLIVRQIKQLLGTETPLCIMRKDVRHFFESVNPAEVLIKMRKDGRVGCKTIQLCETLLRCATNLGAVGVPRGLAISSALTEFLMHKFDHTFTKLPDTLLYNRYVDDIIMISTNRCDMDAVQRLVDESLGTVGLIENKDKCYSLTYEEWTSGMEFEYLGYSFAFADNEIKVKIADKKLKRIKTRITRAFKDFVKTGDEQMLFDRMQFLACISYVKSSSLNKVKVGLPANYSATTGCDSFKEIDCYYQNILHCKNGAFGHKLQTSLSTLYRDKLKLICF